MVDGGTFQEKMESAVQLLKRTEGQSAYSVPDPSRNCSGLNEKCKVVRIVQELTFLFEGDQEISHLIASFQGDEHSVLAAVSLWEGLDIPGPSLSNVIVWALPFPPQDPVFNAKRQASASPYEEVDIPYMLLRLRQGNWALDSNP